MKEKSKSTTELLQQYDLGGSNNWWVCWVRGRKEGVYNPQINARLSGRRNTRIFHGTASCLKAFEKINFKHKNPKKQIIIDKLIHFAALRGHAVPQKYEISEYQKGYFKGFTDCAKNKKIKMWEIFEK